MNERRKALLDAAAVIFGIFTEQCVGPWRHRKDEDPERYERELKGYEQKLVDDVAKATKTLEGFRRARAALMALDKLLPNWVEIDASDHLPRDKWHSFVSNDKDEWYTWLVDNKVPAQKAKTLVQSAFEDQQ